jgi:hypothetical protein
MSFYEYVKYLLLYAFAPDSTKTMEWRMLRLLNKDRQRGALKKLKMQEDLRTVARKHSLDMANKDYFDHVNRQSHNPSDRLKIAGVSEVQSGENLAKIGGFKNPTQKAEDGLMKSPGHRANILNGSYNTVGIGVVMDKNGSYYFTQNFAVRELILKKNIPKKAKIGKAIKIQGEVFNDVRSVIYQVRMANTDIIMDQGFISVDKGKFCKNIFIKDAGLYYIDLYADNRGFGDYKLTNRSEIKAVRGLFR